MAYNLSSMGSDFEGAGVNGLNYQLKGLNYVNEDPSLVKAMVESNIARLRAHDGLNTRIRVKKVHERETNCKYQVNVLVNGAGTLITHEAIDNNIFVALAQSFENIRLRLKR